MSDSSDLRIDPRKAMFVAAELVVGERAMPVKIRNLSTHGALVEADRLPGVGSAVRLVRGPLSVAGTVSRVDGNRAGIELSGKVSVEDWLKGKLPDHQSRVDSLIAEIRQSGREPASIAAAAKSPLSPSFEQSAAPLVQEINEIKALLAALEDALIDDPQVVAAHGEALQSIDEAQQRLAALARRIAD